MLHIRLWDFNIVNYCPKLIKLFLWESKMCRHGLQLLGMLYNVLGMLLVVHCSLNFTAYKAVSGGVSLQCGTPRTLQKHAEVGQGPCKAGQGPCKACQGRPRTLPSMPRSCKASLHILGSHNIYIISYHIIYYIIKVGFRSCGYVKCLMSLISKLILLKKKKPHFD